MEALSLQEYDVEIEVCSELAIKVNDGDKCVGEWLPMSEIEIQPGYKVGDIVTVEVPDWLAREKKLC
jgi:hypothetical protein